MQERSMKDNVKRPLKCLSDFFFRNCKTSLNTILPAKCFLTLTAKKTPVRATEYHVNALFTDSFLFESAFLVSNIPNVCLRGTLLAELCGCGGCCGTGTWQSCRPVVSKEGHVVPAVIRPTQISSQRHLHFPSSGVLLSHHLILWPRYGNGQYFLMPSVTSENWKILSKSSFPPDKTFPRFSFPLRSPSSSSPTWFSQHPPGDKPCSTAQEKTDTNYWKWIQPPLFHQIRYLPVVWAGPDLKHHVTEKIAT